MSDSEQRFPSPREFYRAQRPERFSDSVQVNKESLDRSKLEYYLDTLTSRSQEAAFEDLARGLAERRIAPNLIPHTGPTGGGDSKVDSETFPVSDSLSLAWFAGIGREASSERWGFAFSAKKDWKAKLAGDIAKVVATGRGYRKAFFITNQFVRDKERAKQEDTLSMKHGIEVRILDRNWILDTVFGGRHEVFAIETLGLSPDLKREVIQGPRDLERTNRLDEVEARIGEAVRLGRLDLLVVQDARRSANIARGLERPRTDIDGRFLRARELAERLESPQELLGVLYDWAWTAFFWFEDYERFARLFREALELALVSSNAHELELASTLLGLLRTAIADGKLSAEQVEFVASAKRLLAALDKVSGIAERQSNAYHAKMLALQTRLLLQPPKAGLLLKEMRRVIERAQLLIGYPFEQTANLITALEPFLGDLNEYSSLFERIVEITVNRAGEVTAARMLLRRGAQQLERHSDVNAIRSFGLALGRLYKEESREDLIRALYLIGNAYGRVDLLWAARGSLIIGAGIATDEFHKFHNITKEQVACYERLRWIELQLGRLAQALEWHQLYALSVQALKPELSWEYDQFDALVGIQILKADTGELKQLERLPDALESLGLFMAKAALLFALGHPSELPEELFAVGDEIDSELAFMRKWRDQPASADLRPLSLGIISPLKLESRVLGARVEVTAENRPPAIDLAESILGGLESLLSTGLDSPLHAREPLIKISVAVTEFAEAPFSCRFEYVLGRPHLRVVTRDFDPDSTALDDQAKIKKRLGDALIEVFAHIIATSNENKTIRKLFRDEKALDRSLDFTNTFVSLGNVLGHERKLSIDDWIAPHHKRYALQREVAWDAAERQAREVPKRIAGKPGKKGEEPNFETPTRHSQLQTVSLIREKLWNDAKWLGIGYFSLKDHSQPPLMVLLFRHPKPAIEIFEGWQEELGGDDSDDLLRIAIIRGISVKHPAHYRVVIGTAMEALEEKPEPLKGRVLMMSRIHTMEPETSANLDQFLASFAGTGAYYLAPGGPDEDGHMVVGEPTLLKHGLAVREAWEIGRHDPDAVAIDLDDDINIPPNERRAPAKEVLKWLRKHRR
jgi:hypothetical protein